MKLFNAFFNSEKTGGLLLLLCTAVSLLVANSNWGEGYIHFWHTALDLSFAGLDLNYSVEQWVNDGLMTVFFLLVGLEIGRERYGGELSSFSGAVLPAAAAVGGMIVPAGIYLLFNTGTVTQGGFGIPMATDIAFSLGVLAMAGKRVPHSLKIFLTALAIIDDIGAIAVIAFFYTAGLHWNYLAASAGILLLLLLLNKLHVRPLVFYLLPGLALWYCTLKSGVHPTVSGVLLAFVIPHSAGRGHVPSHKLQKALHVPVGYFIVPFFALANTGIALQEGWLTEISGPAGLGIAAGLVLGKPAGILFSCWLLTKFSAVSLPVNVQWKNLAGAAVLAGIGFTMSIFISNLAFGNTLTNAYAKAAVLAASLVSAAAGLVLLLRTKNKKT